MALGEAYEALAAPWAGRRLHDFADLVVTAREPDLLEAELVRIAGELAHACRVELLLDRDEQTNPHPKRLALWPESAAAMTNDEIEALGYPLCLGLRCGAHYQMTLQLWARPGQLKGGRWSHRVVRRLTTLAAMAAAAERGLHVSQRGRLEASVEMSAAVRDATFLNAILPYALSQAARHREPLTILCLEIGRLADLRRAHGKTAIDEVVNRLAEAVASTLRGSDIVARLDDDRVLVVLPNTGGPDALKVAGVVRGAIAGTCLPQASLPALAVAIGVACFPIDGTDMAQLLSAVDEATHRAHALGPNQTVAAPRGAMPPTVAPPRAPDAARPHRHPDASTSPIGPHRSNAADPEESRAVGSTVS